MTYRFPAISCSPCQWYSWYGGLSPLVSGAYQIRPPWSSPGPPRGQIRGHAANATTTTAAAASHPARAARRVARAAASTSTARPGATHTQW